MPEEEKGSFRKVVKRRIRRKRPGLDLDADIDAVISVNVGREQKSHVSSRSRKGKGVNPDG